MTFTSFLMVKSSLIICLASPSFAIDTNVAELSAPISAAPQKNIYNNVDSITQLMPRIEQYLKAGILPNEIFVVLDVDGTITNKGTPSTNGPFNVAQPRGLAPEMVHWLIDGGINVLFASAWATFNQLSEKREKSNQGFFQTVERLSSPAIGLDRYLTGTSKKIKSNLNGKAVEGMKQGRAVAIAIDDINKLDKSFKFYRQKAYAPYFYDPKKSKEMKVLIFADDSPTNSKVFVNDLEWYNPYLNLRAIDLYVLNNTYTPEEKSDIKMALVQYIKTNPAAEGSLNGPSSAAL